MGRKGLAESARARETAERMERVHLMSQGKRMEAPANKPRGLPREKRPKSMAGKGPETLITTSFEAKWLRKQRS